jgi:tRNA modification GTPase
VLLTNERHERLVREAREALVSARALLSPASRTPEEVVLSELQRATEALEEVTGKRTTEDLLHEIFSTFCVGK